MEEIVDGAIELTVEIGILAILFTVVERLFRVVRAPAWYKRKDVTTDLAFYIFNRIVSVGFVQGIAIALVVAAVALAGGAGLAEISGIIDRLFIDDGASVAAQSMRAWVSSLPSWVQVLAGLLIADFFGYWGHRFFHVKPFWYLHAVHHSPPTLDWLSAVRFHPIYDLIFGTWCTPDNVPTDFGAGETPVPAGFWRQLLYPFRQPKEGATLAKDVDRVDRVAGSA